MTATRGADRGVSDTLGFVFIFALVMSTVGLTFTVGYTGLQETRDFERLNNAERAFDVMGDNFEDMVRRGAPSRATEVKVADAQLLLGEPTVVNVSVDNGTAVDSYRFEVEPVVYETGDGRIVYSNGAIFREDDDGAVVVRHSEFILNESRVLLPVVATRGGRGTAAVGGTTTVLVRAQSPDGQRESFGIETVRTDEVTDVTVNVTSQRPVVWERELSRHEDVSCDPVVGDTVSCTVTDAQQVYVQQTLIDITFA
jgi:hypothetical protein